MNSIIPGVPFLKLFLLLGSKILPPFLFTRRARKLRFKLCELRPIIYVSIFLFLKCNLSSNILSNDYMFITIKSII
jgi:hypothetical protein